MGGGQTGLLGRVKASFGLNIQFLEWGAVRPVFGGAARPVWASIYFLGVKNRTLLASLPSTVEIPPDKTNA